MNMARWRELKGGRNMANRKHLIQKHYDQFDKLGGSHYAYPRIVEIYYLCIDI